MRQTRSAAIRRHTLVQLRITKVKSKRNFKLAYFWHINTSFVLLYTSVLLKKQAWIRLLKINNSKIGKSRYKRHSSFQSCNLNKHIASTDKCTLNYTASQKKLPSSFGLQGPILITLIVVDCAWSEDWIQKQSSGFGRYKQSRYGHRNAWGDHDVIATTEAAVDIL